jgi:alpha-galactosidase
MLERTERVWTSDMTDALARHITGAAAGELAELAAWIQLYKRYRALIHAGRVVRIDTPDDTAWMHGVVAADASAALMSYVQLEEPRNDQPAALRVPGLDRRRRYQVAEVTPGVRQPRRSGLADDRIPTVRVSGAALADIGLAIATQRPLTAIVIVIEAI